MRLRNLTTYWTEGPSRESSLGIFLPGCVITPAASLPAMRQHKGYDTKAEGGVGGAVN